MSEIIKQRMLQARDAIKAKQYDKARTLLKGINHPTAKKWLIQLDNIDLKIKSKAKPKSRLFEYVTIGFIIIVGLIAIAFFALSQTPENTPTQLTATSVIRTSNAIIPTSIPPPTPVDPLAQAILLSVSGINSIEAVRVIPIPSRDEVQYDFTIRLRDDAPKNETLEAISDTIADSQENTVIDLPENISLNVLVIQGIRTENWRYNGVQWHLRAVNGVSVTAPPVPTALPQAVQPQTSSSQNQSGGCNCQSGNTLNCSNFSSQSAAQACHNKCVREVGYDVHELDGDNDNRACERL